MTPLYAKLIAACVCPAVLIISPHARHVVAKGMHNAANVLAPNINARPAKALPECPPFLGGGLPPMNFVGSAEWGLAPLTMGPIPAVSTGASPSLTSAANNYWPTLIVPEALLPFRRNSGPVSTVAEPQTWATLLLGFSLVGFAMRAIRVAEDVRR